MTRKSSKATLDGNFVLDSHALIAFFFKEEGAHVVGRLIKSAFGGKTQIFLNSINLAEVLYVAKKRGGSVEQTYEDVVRLPITILDPTKLQAIRAAHYKMVYRVSLADCYLTATAQTVEGKVVTGDSDFKKIEEVVKVHWIR
ncbi:type II toxin-antitoxin system VapC family toxin [Candidatus Berkelbacteria bacterium]|nr:type II toxin-antitoxin system VapC family toxin [Candidatus Berkelbacteria bacterium]